MDCPRCGSPCVKLAVEYCRQCEVGWVAASKPLSPMPALVLETDDVERDRAHIVRCYRLPPYKKRK